MKLWKLKNTAYSLFVVLTATQEEALRAFQARGCKMSLRENYESDHGGIENDREVGMRDLVEIPAGQVIAYVEG